MERIIIRHLSGSRANQVEEFPVKHLKELIIGRDPTATIKFDPDKDDMISRQHAKITQDEQDETKFILTDLASRNGTYVNKASIEGSITLTVGDVIQLGPRGPEFEFDLDPRPEGAPKATRFDTSSVPPPTREAEYAPFTTATSASEQPRSVGPRTLEFIIGKVKGDTRKSLINISAALLGVLILIGGILWYLNSQKVDQKIEAAQKEMEQAQKVAQKEMEKTQEVAQKEMEKVQQEVTRIRTETIYKEYSPATVFILASWKLINIADGNQVCHFHTYDVQEKKVKKGKTEYVINEEVRIPIYVRLSENVIEPLLMTKISSICRAEDKIGFTLTGSGFVVNNKGFILTNRHVAATWRTSYEQTSQAQSSRAESPTPASPTPASEQELRRKLPPGKVCEFTPKILARVRETEQMLIVKDSWWTKLFEDVVKNCEDTDEKDLQIINKWIPTQTKQFGANVQFDGLHEYFEVKFPNTDTTLKARLVNISEKADVALIKVDAVEDLPAVNLYEGDDDPEPGAPVVVLGYPEVSLSDYIIILSQDPNNPQAITKAITNPTVTDGIIAKVIAGGASLDSRSTRYATFDVYQLTINTTGSGNSGGPVFNTDGKVIGLFSYRWQAGGASVSGAIPIKYGRELIKMKSLQ